jgi:hypothetical protein
LGGREHAAKYRKIFEINVPVEADIALGIQSWLVEVSRQSQEIRQFDDIIPVEVAVYVIPRIVVSLDTLG